MSHNMAIPTWLYHIDAPKGKMFDAADPKFDLAELTEQGWVDNPAKVGQVVEEPAQEPVPVEDTQEEPSTEKNLDEMSDEELYEYGIEIGASVRKNFKTDTLILKIREKLG